MFIVAVLTFVFASQCPYDITCPAAFYLFAIATTVSAVQGTISMLIGFSLAHVERLSMDRLAPDKMKPLTRFAGSAMKTLPSWSRCLFTLSGLVMVAGALVGLGACESESVDSTNSTCSQAMASAPANATRDFAFAVVLWGLVAGFGANAALSAKVLPFLYVPELENGSAASELLGPVVKLTKLWHP